MLMILWHKVNGVIMIRNRITLCLCFLSMAFSVAAHDFVVSQGDNKLYFDITSKSERTAAVVYKGSIAEKQIAEVVGDLEIPARVKHDNVIYTVTGIKDKAFCDAVNLTGIILPATVKTIGDFAFEGCTSLSKIVFPGSDVVFGQGVFYKCSAIKDVTLGGDWTKVNLEMFRWSDSLTSVFIPAKVKKIQNMKKIKTLESIEVDQNNTRFSSVAGVLYNKNRTEMYGCPRNYQGVLKIPEGTQVLTRGALIDCTNIVAIDFPSSLNYVSFRETSRMKKLERLVFRGETPLVTAYQKGQECFVLQVAHQDVELMVPKRSKSVYKNTLVQQSGEFYEVKDDGAIPYKLTLEEMPLAKRVSGVKQFD